MTWQHLALTWQCGGMDLAAFAFAWRGPVRRSMTLQHLALIWQCGGMDLAALGTRLALTSLTWHDLPASGTDLTVRRHGPCSTWHSTGVDQFNLA